jgi:NAD+ synthase (glutamine-hydrolysing)
MPNADNSSFLRLALAQVNPTVGALAHNAGMIMKQIEKARRHEADVVVFPELTLTGYPPEDLLLKPQFISDNLDQIKKISSRVSGIVAIIGFVDRDESSNIYNSAAVIAGKKIIDVYHKIFLPNYGVFDEFRYFKPGKRFPVYSLNDIKFGINICEDIWHRDGPSVIQSRAGAELIININASPYEKDKQGTREAILRERSAENRVIIIYLNAVGGQDELVFDGSSMIYDHRGMMIARGRQFEEEMLIADLDMKTVRAFRKKNKTDIGARPDLTLPAEEIRIPWKGGTIKKSPKRLSVRPGLSENEEIYRALVLGTSDYVRKNLFKGVVIGLSGGIDSSLVAALATDAIGNKNVTGLFMPSIYTSEESREDAFGLAKNLGIRIIEIPITGIFQAYIEELSESFKERAQDTTEENLQARIRGNILMAFSNKFDWLVLTTGNKSEMSVGYATLYGDMAGGFAAIKDVPKTLVYNLCGWRNSIGEHAVIPERVLVKEPSAELKANQKDTDTLPPYEVLDPVLKAYIEDESTFEDILKLGCDRDRTRKIIAMIDRSEYKRRQAPPGIKITSRAFGRDRRFPITNRYRSY